MLIYFLFLNVTAFLIFGWDKLCALNRWWRVQEQTLLLFVLFGGSVGAVLAQQLFHHKTRKQPFRSRFICVLKFHIIVAMAAILLAYSPTIRQAVWSLISQVIR